MPKSSVTEPGGAPRDARHPAVLDILIEDHQQLQDLFRDFEDVDDDEARRAVVVAACAELTVHTQLEEELFYPAIRDEVDEPERIDEAVVEHGIVKDLITQLEYTEPNEEHYDATFRVMIKVVNQHIDEEEHEIFAQVREARLELQSLGEEMRERRAELRAQHGLEPAAAEDEEERDKGYEEREE